MNQGGFTNKFFIICAVLTIAAVSYFVFIREPAVEDESMTDSSVNDSGDMMAPLLGGKNAIYVPDVMPATNVNVGFANFGDGGYVVIHEDNDGKPRAIVGNSTLLSQGENKNCEVMLSRESVDGETLYAMLHSDNGDGVFNPADDPPTTDDQGNIVLMKFQIRVDAEEPGEVSL